MKKLIVIIGMLLTTLLPLAAPQPAGAVDVLNGVCNGTAKPAICGDNTAGGTNPIFGKSGVMTEVINILSLIVGIAAVIGIIIAGLMMVLANGDTGNVQTARRSIVYCLVGLVVAAIAQILVAFVLNKL